MGRGVKIAFSVAGWVFIAAFFVFASVLRRDYEADRRVERFEVVVTDADKLGFVTSQIIADYIDGAGLNPVGREATPELLAAITDAVEDYNFVADAKTYADYEGTVTVKLKQRRPTLRIATDDGRNIYLTREGFALPVRRGAPIRLPIVTGRFAMPFPREFSGDINAYVRENEKKSDKSYIFLCKLINFVDWLENGRHWRDKIVQIVVTEPKPRHSGGIDESPELELIPREGGYSIDMGCIDGYRDKLDRFEAYAASGRLADGQQVVVKYRGQVVCRVKENQKTKNR